MSGVQPGTTGLVVQNIERAEQEIIDYGRRLGMNNFLKKPFDPADLKKCIEAVVGPL